MKHNGEHTETRKPDEILADIERTRHDMDSTLTAIEHRLTPGQLFDQGVDYLKASGGHEFVQNLGVQAKNNPMPIALVGIGLAWLMASGKNPPARYGTTSYGTGLGEKASDMGGNMRDKASSMTGSAKATLSDTTQAVGDRMRQARDSLTSTGQSARQRMSELGGSARHQYDRARDGMDYMMREQPLALGAIGLAIGAVLGAMAPRTRKEDELMGDTRDRLLDQAKEAGQEKLEQAKDVANAAMGAASKEAENRGLKPQAAASGSSQSGSSDKSSGRGSEGARSADWAKAAEFGSAGSSNPGSSNPSSGKPTVSPKPSSGTGTGMPSSSAGNTGGSRSKP